MNRKPTIREEHEAFKEAVLEAWSESNQKRSSSDYYQGWIDALARVATLVKQKIEAVVSGKK